jgi:hypothetical protein
MGKPTPIDEDVRLICVLTCSEGTQVYMTQAFLISSSQRVIGIAISFVKCNRLIRPRYFVLDPLETF